MKNKTVINGVYKQRKYTLVEHCCGFDLKIDGVTPKFYLLGTKHTREELLSKVESVIDNPEMLNRKSGIYNVR